MPNSIESRKARLALPILLLVSLTLLALLLASAWAWLKPTVSTVQVSAISTGKPNPPPVTSGRNIRFTLYDVGILPRSTRIQSGTVLLSFVDRSGQSSGIVVERLNGSEQTVVGQIQCSAGEQRGQGELELQSGTYLVRMADWANNSATLVVEP